MAEGIRRLRTEHAGGKNGGGYYGTRVEAKTVSDKGRRHRDLIEETEGEADYWEFVDDSGPSEGDSDERCLR